MYTRKLIPFIIVLALLPACASVAPPPADTNSPSALSVPTETPRPAATGTDLPTAPPTFTPIPKPTLNTFPFGNFEAKIPEGILVHTFTAGGTWNATIDNKNIGGGTYTISGFQIVIYSPDCQFVGLDLKGTYNWSFDGETLTFKREGADSCDSRIFYLQRKHTYVP